MFYPVWEEELAVNSEQSSTKSTSGVFRNPGGLFFTYRPPGFSATPEVCFIDTPSRPQICCEIRPRVQQSCFLFVKSAQHECLF